LLPRERRKILRLRAHPNLRRRLPLRRRQSRLQKNPEPPPRILHLRKESGVRFLRGCVEFARRLSLQPLCEAWRNSSFRTALHLRTRGWNLTLVLTPRKTRARSPGLLWDTPAFSITIAPRPLSR